jgi:hypothetical protein
MRNLLLAVLLLLWAAPAWAQFPIVAATNTSTDTTSDTNQVISLPANIAAGNLLLLVHHGSGLDSTPNTACTGWTLLDDEPLFSNTSHLAIFYKIASGSEGASVTCTTDQVEDSAACTYRITGWHGTTPPEISTNTENTTGEPDPASVTPSWGAEDTLWIAIASEDFNNSDFTAYPINYGTANITIATHTSNGGACAMAARGLNATSENPGTFTTDATAVGWGAFTVAVRDDGVGGPPPPVAAKGSLMLLEVGR